MSFILFIYVCVCMSDPQYNRFLCAHFKLKKVLLSNTANTVIKFHAHLYSTKQIFFTDVKKNLTY